MLLESDWAKAIMAGGNYGELFEKNIGENTPIAARLNARTGGLVYTPPFQANSTCSKVGRDLRSQRPFTTPRCKDIIRTKRIPQTWTCSWINQTQR
jgi:hypothetical protein